MRNAACHCCLPLMIVALVCGVLPASEPVGRGARLFLTKCYPARGLLTEKDFRQLADAGFTVVVNRFRMDVPRYCQLAAAAGLDTMAWMGGQAKAVGKDQTITRKGNATRYGVPTSPRVWEEVTARVVEQAAISLKHTNYKGLALDYEIYDRGKTDGYCESYDDRSLTEFLSKMGKPIPEPLPPPADRWGFLKRMGLLGLYSDHQYKLVAEQVRLMRKKIDAVNPRFQIGVYGWGVLKEAVLENVSTRAAPGLDLNAETYGRTRWNRAKGGYDKTEPDAKGLKWSLIANATRARKARTRGYPVLLLGGHNPQSPGPADGTQYKFTVRQAFNSAAYADGYWIWTESGFKKSSLYKTRQAWIDAMMGYFGQAHAALDVGDYTWARRQPETIPHGEATTPLRIVTHDEKSSAVWDPLTGRKVSSGEEPVTRNISKQARLSKSGSLRINGHHVELIHSKTKKVIRRFHVGNAVAAFAAGDVDGMAGPELVTLNAGWVKIWSPATESMLLRFRVEGEHRSLYLQPQ